MEKVQVFKQRWQEINNLYYGLLQRKRDIVEEVRTLSQIIKQDDSKVIVADLLSGADQSENHELKSKIDKLNEEYAAIEKKIIAIRSNGGLEGLYQSDLLLKELIQPVTKELSAQAKNDEKKRLSIEKRYEKVLDELLKLEEERSEFLNLTDEKSSILTKITRVTNDSFISSEIRPSYQMKKASLYNQLGLLIRKFS